MNTQKIEFEKIPNEYNLHGRIVEFKETLDIYEQQPAYKTKYGWCFPLQTTNKILFKAKYLLVDGGFGEVHYTSGRMLCGTFGLTPKDCIIGYNANKSLGIGDSKQTNTYSSGNTKVFPEMQSKDTYLEDE